MKQKKIAVIILNHNGKEYLINCLDSIKENTKGINYKVIVVDNNSSDGSQEIIKTKYRWVDLIENKQNKGFAGGNNDGIKYAIKKYYPDYIYLLNNDTIVKESWLKEAVKTAEKSEKIGIVGSKQLTFDKKPSTFAGWIGFFGVKYYGGNEEKKVNWVSGAAFLIKREVFEKIGLFNEIYNPAYYEETDLEKRATDAGFEIWVCPTSVVLHKGGMTTSKEKNKYEEIFYRNRLLFFVKNYGFFYFIPRIFIDLIRGLKNKKLKLVFRGYKKGCLLIKWNLK